MAKCQPGCTCGRHKRNDHMALRSAGKTLCPRCQEWVADDDWYIRPDAGTRTSYCKKCHAEDGRERRLRKMFSLTSADYDRILEHQGGVCYICGRPPKNVRLAVDHDHKTGLIRGLLCWTCNSGLGKWKDDPDRLLRAASYLKQPPATDALGHETYGVVGRVTNKRRKKRLTKGTS